MSLEMGNSPSPSMANKVHIDVVATLDDGEVKFECSWKMPNGNKGSGPIDLPRGSGAHHLIFDLDDKTGLKLRYFDDPTDAIWIAVGSCPSGPGNGNGQIAHSDVDLNRKKLTIHDRNEGGAVDLHYALRFDGDRSKSGPPYNYDPIIRNGGSV